MLERSNKCIIKKFLTVGEVAARIRVPITTLRDWIRIGLLPSYKFNHSIRIEETDYENFLQSHYRQKSKYHR